MFEGALHWGCWGDQLEKKEEEEDDDKKESKVDRVKLVQESLVSQAVMEGLFGPKRQLFDAGERPVHGGEVELVNQDDWRNKEKVELVIRGARRISPLGAKLQVEIVEEGEEEEEEQVGCRKPLEGPSRLKQNTTKTPW